MSVKLLRALVLVWILGSGTVCGLIIYVFIGDSEKILAYTFAAWSISICVSMAVCPLVLMPRTIPRLLERCGKGSLSLECQNRWYQRTATWVVFLLGLTGPAVYFDPALQLPRGEPTYLIFLVAGPALSMTVVLYRYRYRPLVMRYEFRKDRIIFDCGNRHRMEFCVNFSEIHIKRRWNRYELQFEGGVAKSRIRHPITNVPRIKCNIEEPVRMLWTDNVAKCWKPVLGEESMKQVIAFYANHAELQGEWSE